MRSPILRLRKRSEVRPQGGQVYNYKALQHVAGEPAVLDLDPGWEPFFSPVPIARICIYIEVFFH